MVFTYKNEDNDIEIKSSSGGKYVSEMDIVNLNRSASSAYKPVYLSKFIFSKKRRDDWVQKQHAICGKL